MTADGASLGGLPVYNTARYVGSATLDVGRADRLHVRIAGNAVGPYTPFDEPGVELPAYALLQLSASKLLGPVLLNAGVRNLLDKAYPELRAGGFVSPGQPRSFQLTARVQFK